MPVSWKAALTIVALSGAATRPAFATDICVNGTLGARAYTLSTTDDSGGPCPYHQCVYLVRDFSGPYPSETERTYWECYDKATKYTISCALIRGNDIDKYSDVFRQDEGSKSDSSTSPKPPEPDFSNGDSGVGSASGSTITLPDSGEPDFSSGGSGSTSAQ